MPASPWGDLEISDAHAHFFSPAFFRSLAQQKGVAEVGSLLGWDIPASPEDLADRWVSELDHHGVASAMLVASIPGDTASVQAAVARHPQRFGALSMVNPMASGLPGDGGVFLFPAMHRYSLHDDKVAALMEAAAQRPQTLVYVHCGALSVGFRKKLGLPCPFDMRYSNPIDLHEVAARFPDVNFVIPHFGAGYFREALMVADLCPNVYLDTSSSNRWMRYEPGDMDLGRVFRKALEVLGPKRLLFGSDSSWFPRGWVRQVFDDQAAALAALGVDEESARLIFGGNLRRICRRADTTTTT